MDGNPPPCVDPRLQTETDCGRVEATMDEALELLLTGHVTEGMAHLFATLAAARQQLSADEWRAHIEHRVLPHPIIQLVHRDPCTYRGFSKPRGYPGDAVLLDYIYGERPRTVDDDSIATRIQAFTTSSIASHAVRYRRARRS